jgi:flagellar basal-body rod protein FlgB
MTMWIDRVTHSPTMNALALSAQFSERRHRVLAENLANIDTPDYATRRLDPGQFQASLRQALDRSRGQRGSRGLELRGNAQFATRPDGTVEVRPTVEPPPNVLFHDGTNANMEQLLADVAENAQLYEFATTLLRTRLQTLQQAIRGRVI